MMPTNASTVFSLIVSIATFDIIPTEVLIKQTEEDVGLTQVEYQLTDNFNDFGFDSTDPIRNLQIMFLFMLLLMLYPLVSLTLKLLFFWSRSCMKCRSKIDNKLYFNLYIRFFMEAYLEMSLSSLLRCKTMHFFNPSEKFHSSFAILIMGILAAMLLIAAILPQMRFGTTDSPQWKQRYGELTLNLNHKSRMALTYSLGFTLRRIFYAAIVIWLIDRNYF